MQDIISLAESIDTTQYKILYEAAANESKKINDIYLYKDNTKSADYSGAIYRFILKADRIDTKSNEFKDIEFDIRRRRISDSLSKVIHSPNIVIGIISDGLSLPKSFRVFAGKDVRDNNKYKLFIDATEYIKVTSDGTYRCDNIDWLISYLISGMITYIYRIDPNRITTDQTIIGTGCLCFTRLFSYIIDSLVKITSTPQIKTKIDYMIALYYQTNILGKDYRSESGYNTMRHNAKKYSTIDDMIANSVDAQIKYEDFENIDTFCKALVRVNNINITTSAVVYMWLQRFQPGTQFAVEFFPIFASMITHSYIGGFLVNQNLIEKICGKDMVILAKQLLKICEDAIQ